MEGRLNPPFPYYGGKRRWADTIWDRFGHVDVYAEPFAGSLAVLLGRPGKIHGREVVCDTEGHICNFWRAIKFDPEALAYWADWPTIHHDLTARHRWLIEWREQHSQRLIDDPDWYDTKAAGWWVWGISNWIGGEWCSVREDRRPYIYNKGAEAARGAWEWAVANGNRYRIAYACQDGDFDVPSDWQAETLSFGGIRREDRRDRRDLVLFSPACDQSQGSLFARARA